MDPYAASNFMPLQILQGPSLYISSCGPKREHLRDCWVIGHSTYIFTGHLLPDCSLFSDPPRVCKSISNPCQHLNLFSLLVFISLMVQNYKRIFFFLFQPPWGIWSSQAWDQTYAAAVAMPDPLIHCAGLGIKPMSWRCRNTTNPVEPQWELHALFYLFFCYTCDMWNFLSQGSNPHHNSDWSCCSNNSGALTCCITGELPILSFLLSFQEFLLIF